MKNLAILCGIVFLLSGATVLSERAIRTPVEVVGANCASTPPAKVWFKGNVAHFRGVGALHAVLSDDPLVTGNDLWIMDTDLNTKKGSGSLHGTITLYPESVDGTWEGIVGGHWHNFLMYAHILAQGTGDLTGQTLNLDIVAGLDPSDPDVGLPGDVCGPDVTPTAAFVGEGYILNPNAP